MTQLRTPNQTVLKKESQIFYDKEGKPEFILLPFEQFRVLEKTAAQRVYDLSDRKIIKIVDEVREKIFKERYA